MKYVYVTGTALVVCALWSLAASHLDNALLLPTPTDIANGAMQLWTSGDLLPNILASLQRLLVGLVIGVPLGATLGCLMGLNPWADALLSPYVRAFNAIPALALVPFSLLLFGVTEASRYALLTYTIALTVLLSARQGAHAVPPLRLKTGATLGLSQSAVLFRIVIPSCFPAILAGVRTAIGLGVMVIVAAEMLGAESGLGYMIMQARSQFSMVSLLVGVIGLGVLSLALDRLFTVSIDLFFPRWSSKRRI